MDFPISDQGYLTSRHIDEKRNEKDPNNRGFNRLNKHGPTKSFRDLFK